MTWHAFIVILNRDDAAMRSRFSTSSGIVADSAGVKNCATALATKMSTMIVVVCTPTSRRVAATNNSASARRMALLPSRTARLLARSTSTPAKPLRSNCASMALTIVMETSVELPLV